MIQFKPIRRKLLHIIGASSLVGCASRADLANAQTSTRRKTPTEPEGPFYPVSWNGDVDGNLVRVDQQPVYQAPNQTTGAATEADNSLAPGTLLTIRGQILRGDGAPAANARVDIWQTDHTGRYRHPQDAGDEPLHRGFQGYGRVRTDKDGRYEFMTVKPANYGSRPPHVHFRVDDGNATLITQMYFAGESKERGMLARAGSLLWADDRTLLTVSPKAQANGPATAEFNIYL